MRSKDESKFKVIADEIKRFMIAKGRTPSQRELANSVGLGRSAVCRYIRAMKEKGLIEGEGREIKTKEIQLISVPIVDCLLDSRVSYDNANINDYVFVSRKIYGEGEFGIVRAIDDSMSASNICFNSFVVVRRQRQADIGQIVLVLSKEKYYLRRLVFDSKRKVNVLVSESETYYDDITQYEIRGVAVTLISHFDEKITQRYLNKLLQ